MKNILVALFFFSTVFGGGILYAQSTMTDDQIVEFIADQNKKNISQQDIATALLKQGITPARLQQIQEKYGQTQEKTKQTTPVTGVIRENPIEEGVSDKEFNDVKDEVAGASIFGRNIFNNPKLTFSPDVNSPTPVNYMLGTGDEVIIEIWGASQMTIRETISPEGNINIDAIGPVYLNGMTVEEANKYLRDRFSNVFAGVGDGSSQIKLTLGRIRTIQVSVMGEVSVPGNYAVSSLSTVLHALYRSGGVNDIGSLRSIKIYRSGKLLKDLDIYQYILNGNVEDDVRLNDKDVIIVSPYNCLVEITGKVKRPMKYEMRTDETVLDLINYAGGFVGDAYKDNVRLTRLSGNQKKIYTLNQENFSSFDIADGDLLVVSPGLDLFENRVEIKGAVFRGGFYEIGADVKTVKDLIEKSGGLRGDAFLNRGVIIREKDDLTSETVAVDVRKLLSGEIPDIPLRKNDTFYIPSMTDITEDKIFTIYGEIPRPGSYAYADNTTLEDLIIQAGGLLESASMVKVDIARRVSDPRSLSDDRVLSETYTFGLKDGLVVDGTSGFALEPYDHIYVRRSPNYHTQQNIVLQGEVTFPGTYALNKKTERISDVIKRAGSLTTDAYSKGARLVRKRTEEELFKSQTALKMSMQGSLKDSISVKTLNLDEFYDVGIELDKALSNPNSDYDLVLREGDRIIIPEYESTVKINGAVMHPNTVLFQNKKKVSYYINQAGGYADNAKKNKMYVIYTNGTVTKAKGGDKNVIQPGCEIVVPSKEVGKKTSMAEIVTVGSTVVTSVASVMTMLIYLMTR
ncbi:SLBB domain-containing protein [Viscerimonas tarda]